MKRLFIIIQLFLFLSLGFSLAICGSPTDSVSSSNKPAQASYMIASYVIGSGGVLKATGANYHHSATAGETIVGGMQGANNLLLSGFWLPAEYYGYIGVEQQEMADMPKTFELHQNYPNPFNPQTAIQYDLPYECLVTVEIFNVMGQRIRLVSSKIQGPGQLQVIWDGRDEQGKMMGSGIYLYRVTALETKAGKGDANVLFQQTKKMLLVK